MTSPTPRAVDLEHKLRKNELDAMERALAAEVRADAAEANAIEARNSMDAAIAQWRTAESSLRQAREEIERLRGALNVGVTLLARNSFDLPPSREERKHLVETFRAALSEGGNDER